MPGQPFPSLPDWPPPKQKHKKEKEEVMQAPRKTYILWHTNNGCHLTKHARTGTLKQVCSAYTQTRQQWNPQNHRDQLESTKFSPNCVRVKKSSLGQKLCTSYLNTYHYTTGSRRTRGSRVEKKRGKTQSILMIKNGSSVSSNLGTQNNTQINRRGGTQSTFCMRSWEALCFPVLTLLIWKQSLLSSPR